VEAPFFGVEVDPDDGRAAAGLERGRAAARRRRPSAVLGEKGDHYRISAYRRMLKAHGEGFAIGHRWRTLDGNAWHGKDLVCGVPSIGHTANIFAMCFQGCTTKKRRRQRRNGLTA
jgi:hypothetical protein